MQDVAGPALAGTSGYRFGMTILTVAVPGGQLHVLDEGQPTGPPILLLHAGIADLTAWDALAPLLAAAGQRVVRYDARGFGRSVTEDVEYSNRADAIAVLDALEMQRATLVGNSRGGQIAFDTAIDYPDRVHVVVGVGAGLGGFDGVSTDDEEAIFVRMEALEAALESAGPAGDAELVDAIVDLDVRFWVDGPGQAEDRVPAAIRDHVRSMDAAHYDPSRVQGRPRPLTPPAGGRLAELRCPVLAVAGALDVSDVVQTARHLEAHAPNACAVILPDVAHMIGMEAPERLAALILEFLSPGRPGS